MKNEESKGNNSFSLQKNTKSYFVAFWGNF